MDQYASDQGPDRETKRLSVPARAQSKSVPPSPSTESFPHESKSEEAETPVDIRSLPTRKHSTPAEKRAYVDDAADRVCRLQKYSLYETSSRFYLVGADIQDSRYRILKIERSLAHDDLNASDDGVVYSKHEISQLLNAVDEGNKTSGGLKLRVSCWGLLGFIRFTNEYYMLLITKRSQVAMIGGHYIYQIDGTELISLASPRAKFERHPEEGRFISILHNLDLNRSFYFSPSYDVTNTLQQNIKAQREAVYQHGISTHTPTLNEMFVWNHHLLHQLRETVDTATDWCQPIIHGFVDQAPLSIYGRTIYITLIARRSRFFAGARFLKRGANDLGYVANDVETEQIVSDMLTTSFHAPELRLFASPNFTSYVQHRGSIPLYWTQDSTGVTPKPAIELNLVDPFYTAAALHFNDLFRRYGAPVYVLNLVKARERTPRESKLLKEYNHAISYLNQFLPEDKKIVYKAWDMSRASKSRDQDVIGTLESIAQEVLEVTGFFHNGDGQDFPIRMQNGVARTNCIDCLDRTNAAQFVISKLALGHQLHALGVLASPTVDFDTDAVDLFSQMYHNHGDTIAMQYGGSHLVNTMETYRKINQWTSHSRDMVESFKRYYNNSFFDSQRQEAYNLFLGNYIFTQGQPMLWDLPSDYYLHHTDPRLWSSNGGHTYVHWFTPEFLFKRELPPLPRSLLSGNDDVADVDEYWLEYYRPPALTSLQKVYAFKLSSHSRYLPFKNVHEGRHSPSPFRPRARSLHEREGPEKPRHPKGVRILEPAASIDESLDADDNRSIHSLILAERRGSATLEASRPRLLKELLTEQPAGPSTMHDTPATGYSYKDKTAATQWALNQFITSSLHPMVTASEMEEYGRYVSHPQHLPLVVSNEETGPPSLEYLAYVQSVSGDTMLRAPATDEDIADYEAFLDVGDEPLTVMDADTPKKRYKAYRQWLKGKSFFKQPRPEL